MEAVGTEVGAMLGVTPAMLLWAGTLRAGFTPGSGTVWLRTWETRWATRVGDSPAATTSVPCTRRDT